MERETMKTVNKIALALLYKLETPSGERKFGYGTVRKVFDFSYNRAYGFSPYDYSREWR